MTVNAASSRPSRFVSLKRLWPFLRPYRLIIIGAGIALAAAGSTFLVIPAVLRHVIDEGLKSHNVAVLDRSLLWMLLAAGALAAATFARYSLVARLGERVIADLRRAVYAHILKLSPDFFETARSGDILSRLSTDAGILQAAVGPTISIALRNVVLLTGGIALMLATSLKMTLLVLLVIPLVVVPIIAFGRKVRRLSRQSQERVGEVSAAAEETIYGIRTVQAFTHEDKSRTAFNALIESAFQAALGHIRVRAFLVALVIFFVLGAVCVILWIGGRDLLAGKISSGQLTSFIAYAIIAASATGAISEAGGELQRAAGAADRIFELLETTPSISPPNAPSPLPEPTEGRGCALAFENVTFHYPARPKAALNNIGFAIAPGERIAIVGPSGAGKSTLFQLALRFYDPQQGRILLDGVDVAGTDPYELRQRLALVPQDPVIFSADAWTNIAYGKPNASPDDIRAAARAAYADDFISALPQGYDTHLGEKGVRLSGGQKQRIAIARALLRDAPVLLLDEATSALDSESEKAVQQALDVLMKGRTTLIIAHRLSTVRNADRILVMDQGRLAATGTHRELVAENGLYARLASLQFSQN